VTRLRDRGVSRSVGALALCVVVLVVASLAAAVEPAHGCSCIPPDPWSVLKQADGAFVGRLVSRREVDQGRAVLTFRVERAVKGKIGATIEVTTANNGAACGIETSVGQRIGLFLAREGDEWVGHLCWQVAPEDLLAAASLPAPTGRGSAALFVGGRFGPARTLALDAKGRTLAYGIGKGRTWLLSPCPGRQRLAEIGGVAPRYEVAIRDGRSLRVIRRQPLVMPGRRRPQELRCEDRAGSSVLIFARRWCCDGPNGSALFRVRDRRLTVVWNGAAYTASLTQPVVYLCTLDRRGRHLLLGLDPRTGRVEMRRLLAIFACAMFVPDAKGQRLAGVSSGLAGTSHIVLLNLRQHGRKLRTTALRAEAASGDVYWLRDGLLFLPRYGGDTGRVLDLTLRTRSRFRWIAGDTALVDSTAFGVHHSGTLVAANVPIGRTRTVRRLPGEPYVIVSAKS
jgi:hypothetical protein